MAAHLCADATSPAQSPGNPGNPRLSAAQTMAHHGKTFALAARLLAPQTRADAQVLYAFARTLDDLADRPELGPWPERMAQLDALGALATSAAPPEPLGPAHPEPLGHARAQPPGPASPEPLGSAPPEHASAFARATAQLVQRRGLDAGVLTQFVSAIRADASPRSLRTQDDLAQFAFGVAGTVGLLMRPLLGAPSAADAAARALGMAMQLTNIARDVLEDAAQGRCYIPSDWGVTLAALKPNHAAERAQAFSAVVRLLDLADDWYRQADAGLAFIPTRNRRAIRVAAGLYRAIGLKIRAGGPEAYWQGRAYLTTWEKLRLGARLALGGDWLAGAMAPTGLEAGAAAPPQGAPLVADSQLERNTVPLEHAAHRDANG